MNIRVLPAVFLALAPAVVPAEEPHGAIIAFKDFVTAVKAKDGKARHFVPPAAWGALVKSGKMNELISEMIAAADKEDATYSFKETKGSNFFLTGEITIHPDGVRVPILRGGDPWTLDVAKLVGEIEVSEEEKDVFQKIGRLVMNLNSYKNSSGVYPTTAQGLQALVEKPTTDPVPTRWFRLQSEIPKDPWGNDFVYTSEEGGFTVRSLGPDGKESGDDLVNPF